MANTATSFGSAFGCAGAARAAGLLHDIGKASQAFQGYLAHPSAARGPDHSTAGAREAAKAYPNQFGRVLAYVVAGHHAGLADFADLERRLVQKEIEPYSGWQELTGALPDMDDIPPTRPPAGSRATGFGVAFLTRMLFSCLVDADSVATAFFQSEAAGQSAEDVSHVDLSVLLQRLRIHMTNLQTSAAPSPVNTLRTEVLEHAVSLAGAAPGLFDLARSVIVLDEAQTPPVHLLRPSSAALEEHCQC